MTKRRGEGESRERERKIKREEKRDNAEEIEPGTKIKFVSIHYIACFFRLNLRR